jgi:hypothetical protein
MCLNRLGLTIFRMQQGCYHMVDRSAANLTQYTGFSIDGSLENPLYKPSQQWFHRVDGVGNRSTRQVFSNWFNAPGYLS